MLSFYKKNYLAISLLAIIAIEIIKEFFYPHMYDSCKPAVGEIIFPTVMIGGSVELLIVLIGLVTAITAKKGWHVFVFVLLGVGIVLWSILSLFRFMCG